MPTLSDLPPAVRRPLTTAFRTAGKLTSHARMRPSFLLAGGQRCGTTSLHRTLKQHPSILTPVHKKGIRYFDIHYGQGDDWYQGHFPLRLTAQRIQRRTSMPVVAYESTSYYMFHPLAPERIARDLDGVRLVVMLRDPVERAYSAYAHELARGYETESFERALELEPERLDGEIDRLVHEPGYVSRHHQHHAYLTRGQYVEQLERVAAAVGRDRLHVVESADFFADPPSVYAGVVDFLGLPAWPDVQHVRHNARPRETMPADLRRRLEAHFEPYDERLATWLGRTPSWRT